MTEPRRERSTEAFFGRRNGKTLRPLQRSIRDELLPQLKLDLAAPAPDDLRSLFSAEVDLVRMEIGFGGGEHLVFINEIWIKTTRHPSEAEEQSADSQPLNRQLPGDGCCSCAEVRANA